MKLPTIIYASLWYLILESESFGWFVCGILTVLIMQLSFD